MENAIKALLIAASVLIGLMIISIGITLFASLQEYVETTQEEIISKRIQQFNIQFTKYINYNNETREKEFILTIHDIVTAANTAYENNLSYNLTEYDGNNYYVTVNMPGNNNLENNISSKSAEILSTNLGKEYKCSYEDLKFNKDTRRVYEINFHEL